MIILRTAGVLISFGILYFVTLICLIHKGEPEIMAKKKDSALTNILFVVVMGAVAVVLVGLAAGWWAW